MIPGVRRCQEDAGTAALAGFGLPPAEVLAVDQRLTDRALALRDAGLAGSPEELRARAYLDTLLGRESAPSPQDAQPQTAGSQHRLAAWVNLTVPLLTQLGLAAEPGDVAGFGPVDPAQARELIALAAADLTSRFCVTVTGAAGQAIGHGCVPGRPPDLGGSPGFTVTISPLAGDRCDHRHPLRAGRPSLFNVACDGDRRAPECTAL